MSHLPFCVEFFKMSSTSLHSLSNIACKSIDCFSSFGEEEELEEVLFSDFELGWNVLFLLSGEEEDDDEEEVESIEIEGVISVRLIVRRFLFLFLQLLEGFGVVSELFRFDVHNSSLITPHQNKIYKNNRWCGNEADWLICLFLNFSYFVFVQCSKINKLEIVMR